MINDLPAYYMTYGAPMYGESMQNILTICGFMHVKDRDRALYLSKIRDLFILTELNRHPYSRYKSYTPIALYKMLDWPERHIVYSEKELKNLIDMLYGDKDTALLSIKILNKANLRYIDYCSADIWQSHADCYLEALNDPYSEMMIGYIASNEQFFKRLNK